MGLLLMNRPDIDPSVTSTVRDLIDNVTWLNMPKDDTDETSAAGDAHNLVRTSIAFQSLEERGKQRCDIRYSSVGRYLSRDPVLLGRFHGEERVIDVTTCRCAC